MFGFGKRGREGREAQRALEAEEDRRAFSFGVQIANEAILRTLIRELLNLTPPDQRQMLAANLREEVDAEVRATLIGAQRSAGLEFHSATEVIEFVFGGAPTLVGQTERKLGNLK